MNKEGDIGIIEYWKLLDHTPTIENFAKMPTKPAIILKGF